MDTAGNLGQNFDEGIVFEGDGAKVFHVMRGESCPDQRQYQHREFIYRLGGALGNSKTAIGISIDGKVISMLFGRSNRDNDNRFSFNGLFKFSTAQFLP
jgi:hypothetical protein